MKKKRKIRKSIIIFTAFSIFIVVMIVISTLYNQNTQTKPPAREYFKITDVYALADPQDPENQTILVKMLNFKITPIKGDAHYVSINPGGTVTYDHWPWFKEIKCNQTVDLAAAGMEITYPRGLLAKKNEGYAITLRITCSETSTLPDDQRVKIYLDSNWLPWNRSP